VNLIGEHVDYMGYGVLPMAIKQARPAELKAGLEANQSRQPFRTVQMPRVRCAQDTIVAVRRGGDKLRLNNMASAHGEQDFELDPEQVGCPTAARPGQTGRKGGRAREAQQAQQHQQAHLMQVLCVCSMSMAEHA